MKQDREEQRCRQAEEWAAHVRRAAIIDRLRAPPVLDGLSWAALRSILAVRILALCGPTGRDPIAELGRRFRSIEAARSFLRLADSVGRCWPENVQVCRPCSCILSPDEMALAAMVDAARTSDREAFGRTLSGFVRPDRQEALYAVTVAAVAAIDGTQWQGPDTAL